MKRWLLLLLPLLMGAFLPCEAASPSSDAAATLIVYNDNDPSSVNLAATYADKRGIPFTQMIGLNCPVQETISRHEYDTTIAIPLRETLISRGWWKAVGNKGEERVVESSIRFVALMRGMPLRIARQEEPYPGDRVDGVPQQFRFNEASVDSELACLGMGSRQITGPVDNPFFRSRTPLRDHLLPSLLLVCRLDAATPGTVQRMIDDAARVEATGLWGFAYIDSRQSQEPGLKVGDDWLRKIADLAMREGMPWVHENTPELFPRAYPMREAALYYGWYTDQVSGPFEEPTFRFVPGAVAVHIHSFSAATLRGEPPQHWCAPLLERGATATLGNVFEPYLQLTPDLAFFHERLAEGATFAEAAYASQNTLSWMTTFIGDPLYRPFRNRGRNENHEFAVYARGAQTWFREGRSAGENVLRTRGREMKSGVIFEGLAALQVHAAKDPDAALRSLEIARGYYRDEEDRQRCVLHGMALLFNGSQREKALELARTAIRAHPHARATALIQQVVPRLEQEPAAPASAPKATPPVPRARAVKKP